ncbi:MAG TPA: hypothetical protein VMR99_02310 [Candidatus Paceibacterota bacterium]|nr:hypothetical protein [Candidatus Paceibacterota bacterium]
MDKRIPRKLVERFILKKKLGDIVGFLEYIIDKPAHMKTFAAYAQINLPQDIANKILLHGSLTYHKQLIVSQKEKFIYATNDPNYAIFLGIIDLKNASAGVLINQKGVELTIDTDFVNGPSSLRAGWVHAVMGKDFKQKANHEYFSKKSTDVLFAVPVLPTDLTVPVVIKI